MIKYTQLSPEALIRNRERHLKVQKRKSNIIAISLIAIGSLIIVWSAITYYIEIADCPPEPGCGWMDLPLLAATFFGSIFLIPGIIYPYRNRIKEGYDCCLMVLLPIPTTYFLTWLIITIL